MFEDLRKNYIACDPDKLYTFLEAIQHYFEGYDNASLKVYDCWKRNPDIQKLVKDQQKSKYSRIYSFKLDNEVHMNRVKEGETINLGGEKIYEYYRNKNYVYSLAEESVLRDQADKSAVVTRLANRNEMIFDFDLLDDIEWLLKDPDGEVKSVADESNSVQFINTIRNTIGDNDGRKILIIGENPRAQVERFFSLSTDVDDMQNDVVSEIMKQLDS